MSKTYHRVNRDDGERAQEAPTHKKRRETKRVLEDWLDRADSGTDYTQLAFEDSLETFEPIAKKKKAS